MKITKDNYQEYVVDWLEGSLDRETLRSFDQFLQENPQIRQELEELLDFDTRSPEVPARNSGAFSGLKRTINEKAVNAQNFLEFVMARMDGELDGSSAQSLEAYLGDNPKHAREARLFELTHLTPDNSIVYDTKDLLKRPLIPADSPVNVNNLEEVIVASLEGDLDGTDEGKLQKYLTSHPEAMELYRQFARVKLTPDLSVTFSGKGELKKRDVIVMASRQKAMQFISIAASLALIAGIFLFDQVPVIDRPFPKASVPVEVKVPANIPVEKDQVAIPSKKASKGTSRHQSIISRSVKVASVSEPVMPTGEKGGYWPSVKYDSRNIQSIASLNAYPSSGKLAPYAPSSGLAQGNNLTAPKRLTIEEFSIENIRYFTGGGNEKPGLLAQLTLPKLVEATNPYERINSAGQTLFIRWTEWKERTLDELIPYR